MNAVDGAVNSKADDRTRALQGMAAAAQGYQAYSAIANGGALVKVESGIGFKTARSQQDNRYAQSQSNALSAGGNVNLKSSTGDIRAQHTQIRAGNTITLDSVRDILLESGRNRQQADGKNSNAGLSVGVGASLGAQTGVYVYGEAGFGKGKNHLDANTHSNTTLQSDKLVLKSKGDTTLSGAQASAKRIDADIGGKLHIESLQDQVEQSSSQTGAGVRVQVSLGTAWEVGGNYSSAKAKGSLNAVGRQSGLFAGEGGYHIKANEVALKGGAIASTAGKAHNELTTNKLSFEDISNHSDPASAHRQLAELPDLQAVLEKQKTVAQATGSIVSAVSTFSSDRVKAAEKEKAAAQADLQAALQSNDHSRIATATRQFKQAEQSAKDWGIGGGNSRALNAVTTAITGALGGQSGLQVAANTIAPYAAETIGNSFGQNGSDPNKTAQLFSHAVLGATLAYVNGGNGAAGAVAGAGSEAAAIYLTQTLYKDKATDPATGKLDPNRLPEKDKEHIRSLTAAIGAVAGGIAGDSSLNAQIAGVVGQNAVENNWLSSKEVNRLVELDRACNNGDNNACKGYLDLRKLDRERDLSLLAACQQPSSTACRNLKAQANIANASLASGYFDPVLHPELWGDKEKITAHKKEYSDTDAVLRLSEGWTPEQIMREAKMLNAARTVLADLTFVGTIKDFKEADTLADYAVAVILAAPGLKQADALKHAGNFTQAYKAAKEAGDIKGAKEIIELARTAEKSPNNLAKLAQKEKQLNLLGQDFGKLDTVVKNPEIKISGLRKHYVDRKLERGVTSDQVIEAIKNPGIVLKQSNGGYLFLSQDTAVVVNKSGQLVTTYGKKHFDNNINMILNKVK